MIAFLCRMFLPGSHWFSMGHFLWYLGMVIKSRLTCFEVYYLREPFINIFFKVLCGFLNWRTFLLCYDNFKSFTSRLIDILFIWNIFVKLLRSHSWVKLFVTCIPIIFFPQKLDRLSYSYTLSVVPSLNITRFENHIYMVSGNWWCKWETDES